MKYNIKAFNSAVSYYEKKLKKFRNKNVFIVMDISNSDAFFSTAPLSRALHNLGCDMAVRCIQKTSKPLDALIDVWNAYDALKKGKKARGSKELKQFLDYADKKTKGKLSAVFKRPDVFVRANKKEFLTNQGFRMDFKTAWHNKYKWPQLIKTGKILWNQLYNLKKKEKAGIGFELIKKMKDMKYPLEDYLDSYSIARAMLISCPARKTGMTAYTSRKSQLEESERTSELSATLLGCELEKNIDEPIFKKYRLLSKALKLNRLATNDAAFFIKGEGYPGKHIFGESIGYPTPDKKSRWDSPGGIIYQLPWAPQTKHDSRGPRSRLGFTETLPIDIFIESCNIDWMEMKRKDDELIKLVNQSDKIIVDSKKTQLEVYLKNRKGRRQPLGSDVDIRQKLDKKALKKGIKAGTFANIPGGEMFLTPEYITGTVHGDVVINIDKSYTLNSKNPVIVKCNKKGYKLAKGPKKIISKIEEKKKESMDVLKEQEKNKALPKKIIKMKKDNFNKIGEFAINTNPKARLCNYLIVNEKIAGMIHIALGSGFEDDRSSVYHYDIVINARQQKLDIYGLKGKKKLWMMKKGELAV